ncbi:DNA alkylation repair protein [Viridibacillus sp. YIM B01967]|uniref:DNA alkylation repair protein n=1 Tax=Viridibacillus soli TaxID=2798301 RepID=A0ABS1H5D7_9BACL|nr:DNA alkylation repair protein [Viridibacillus soli]MBK3494634.1 DNA alkylation repair protein [Viridibacillus soli]
MSTTEIRALPKKIKKNHLLAMDLWETSNTDAMMRATMIMDYKQLTIEEINEMTCEVTYTKLLDEFVVKIIGKTAFKNQLPTAYISRSGWNLLIVKLLKKETDSATVDIVLEKLQQELKKAPVTKQKTMNRCLVEIGIRYPDYTAKCIGIGKLDDRPVAKGCTSEYAPEWTMAVLNKDNNKN